MTPECGQNPMAFLHFEEQTLETEPQGSTRNLMCGSVWSAIRGFFVYNVYLPRTML